eukprot:5814595-Amphidinium_carterae.1
MREHSTFIKTQLATEGNGEPEKGSLPPIRIVRGAAHTIQEATQQDSRNKNPREDARGHPNTLGKMRRPTTTCHCVLRTPPRKLFVELAWLITEPAAAMHPKAKIATTALSNSLVS